MNRFTHRLLARAIGVCVTIVGVSACSSEPGDPAPLNSGDVGSCKSACALHTPPTCTAQCQSACDGRRTGSMSTSNFPDVDSVDCNESGLDTEVCIGRKLLPSAVDLDLGNCSSAVSRENLSACVTQIRAGRCGTGIVNIAACAHENICPGVAAEEGTI